MNTRRVAGKLETIKKANDGDVVIKNLIIGGSAESYTMDFSTFEKRYEVIDKESIYIDGTTYYWCKPRGQVYAFEYIGETITFKAPWDEDMVCENGDFLASPVGGKETDIYRIEKDTFNKTYRFTDY